MKRRDLLATPAALIAARAGAQAAPASEKTLRYAFVIAETGFDPAQLSDLYSRIVTGHIFDSLYRYDHLARPFLIKPGTAVGSPEVSDDFKTWTVRIQPGIFFADDPAFGGRKRELVAEDYVFSYKRFFDPAVKSPLYSNLAQERLIGLAALREAAIKGRKPFDYDRPVEGLRALDRYTLQFRLEEARPRFLYKLAGPDVFGALAREVVEAYGDKIMEHPVGTGPFKLDAWRRSSLIRLVRNPGFRELFYDAEPNPDDAEGQALLAKFKGRRLPMLDAVEISVIEAPQPRWLSFLNREFDFLYLLPEEYADTAIPRGRLAPNLHRQKIRHYSVPASDRMLDMFNMDDPLVGGYTPERVALRRAIALGTDIGAEVREVRHHQAIPAQSMVAPGTWGYDASYKSPSSDFDPAAARALLDIYGYLDRDGDGWREMPDGSPLVLQLSSQPDARSRPYEELWERDMRRLGLRLEVRSAQWPENLKAARGGQLMIWQLGFTSTAPDVQDALEMAYGPAAGGQGLARFRLPAFDAAYRELQRLPDGAERLAALRRAQALVAAYMPYRYRTHRIVTDMTWPWVLGYRRPAFGTRFWEYVDIDNSLRA
jgi:ABC-type transport system substrate-binding protein